MTREDAEFIVDAVKRWEAIFGELHELSLRLEESEGKALRGAIGPLVIDIYLSITRDIFSKFPDLNPDKEDDEG